MKKQLFKSRGLSLIEVLVALAMLGAVILVSAGLIIPLRVTRDSNVETQALTYARSYIELVRQWWLDPNKYEASPLNVTMDPVWPVVLDTTIGTADLRLPTGWTLTKTATIRTVSGLYSNANSSFATTTTLRRFRDTLRDVTITVSPSNGSKSVTISTVIALTNPQVNLMNTNNRGFSLIELLISLGILGVIVVAITTLFRDSVSISRTVRSSSQMQQELRIGANIIGDEIQRAVYVFPPHGSTISTSEGGTVTVDWSDIELGAGNAKTSPSTPEKTKWKVTNPPTGANPPFLAMIVAPINPQKPCLATDTATTMVENGVGCYKFIAFYPVIRAKVSRGGPLGNSSTSNELLPEITDQDTATGESGRWVIMEFRMNLNATTGTVPWSRVGCDKRVATIVAGVPVAGTTPCTNPPTIDPIRANPQLPVLTCTIRCSASGHPFTAEVSAFQAQMNSTVNWINTNSSTVSPQILIDGIDESYSDGGPGFVVRMPEATYDARGVTEVRLSLRGRTADRTYGYADATGNQRPISYFFAPRNIAPLKAGVAP